MTVTDNTGRPHARINQNVFRHVTEDMIEEESLLCEAPTQILVSPKRETPRRGVATLTGNFTVRFDEVSGTISL